VTPQTRKIRASDVRPDVHRIQCSDGVLRRVQIVERWHGRGGFAAYRYTFYDGCWLEAAVGSTVTVVPEEADV
jgi:hypothetical protein